MPDDDDKLRRLIREELDRHDDEDDLPPLVRMSRGYEEAAEARERERDGEQ